MGTLSKNTIYFRQLNENFFTKYRGIDEFLKKNTRGHGIMIMDYLDLLVAVPLRSSLKPYMKKQQFIFPYKVCNKGGKRCLKGMDFSKLIIMSEEDLQGSVGFVFQDDCEKQYYIDNYSKIVNRLGNYIKRYKRLCYQIQEGVQPSITQLRLYRYSTIRNFHESLGIHLSKESFILTLQERGLLSSK